MEGLTKSGADGCRCVHIGSDGCGWMQVQKKKQKKGNKSPKWVSRGCFEAYAHSEKSRKLAVMAIVLRGDHVVEILYVKRCVV